MSSLPEARNDPLLTVEGLTVVRRDDPSVRIVDDVSFTVGRGESVGLAGESGCGKTTTALALLGLLPGGLRRSAGEMTLRGRSGDRPLHQLRPAQWRRVRWASISMVFQGAMNALDPVMSVGQQIAEAILLHEPKLGRSAAGRRVGELLDQVGVPSNRARHFPHEFSGGQKQRVMIALALACRPELVIADEPTTALDVITQAQILDLLGQLRRDMGLSLLLITHDLSVLADTCDRVDIMYAGQVVESGGVEQVYRRPEHPYTARLLELFGADDSPGTLPRPIPGSQPDPAHRPAGCRFHDRCEHAVERCALEAPEVRTIAAGREVRCHFAPWPGDGLGPTTRATGRTSDTEVP